MPQAERVISIDGVQHRFPADATDAEISEALEAPPVRARGPKPPRTWTDVAVDALPMIGGSVGGVLGAMTGIPTLGLTAAPAAITGASLLGAGGEAAKQLINRYRGAEAPETPLDAAKDIGVQGVQQGLMEGAGQVVARGASAIGRSVYHGYLKPPLSKAKLPRVQQTVQTAIDEALPVTEAGAARADTVITSLRREVDALLAKSPGEVDLHQVAERVRAFAKQRYYKPGKPLGDYEAAMEVANRLDNHPSIVNPFAPNSPAPVSLSKANEVKRGLDESVGEAAFGVKSGATKTSEKFARREMRQAIEGQAPAVGALNARESRLIDAAKALNRAVGREGNKNAISGVTSLMGGTVGAVDYYRSGDPYAAAAKGLALKMALTPAVATRAAIVAARLGQKSGAAAATVARAAVQAVSEMQDDAGDVPEDIQEQQQ